MTLKHALAALLILFVLPPVRGNAQNSLVMRLITASDTDPQIHKANMANVVMYSHLSQNQMLLVFLTGTGGVPVRVNDFLQVGANQGYRVLALAYDNEPSVNQACYASLAANCAGLVREKRIFGDDVTKAIDDLPAEAISNRLVKLLQFLHKDCPNQGWSSYLDGINPNWGKIVIAGHSQGGGMAAYIGKARNVARVVILSGGWDLQPINMIRADNPSLDGFAPWIASPSATPLERWYATYHIREVMASKIKAAYKEMGIPEHNIQTVVAEPQPKQSYHSSIIHNVSNSPTWKFILGESP